MTATLRRAHSDDLDQLVALERALFGTDAWSHEVFSAELSHPDSFYLVAMDGGHIVGYGGLRATAHHAMQGDIQTLAVVPQARRGGLGRSILQALIEEAANRGVVDLFLEVRADNPAAIALYTAEGFREISRRPGYYQPDGVDAIVMVNSISPSPVGQGE